MIVMKIKALHDDYFTPPCQPFPLGQTPNSGRTVRGGLNDGLRCMGSQWECA